MDAWDLNFWSFRTDIFNMLTGFAPFLDKFGSLCTPRIAASEDCFVIVDLKNVKPGLLCKNLYFTHT